MIEADRLVSADSSGFEEAADRAIRPKLLAEYVGQPQAGDNHFTLTLDKMAFMGNLTEAWGHNNAGLSVRLQLIKKPPIAPGERVCFRLTENAIHFLEPVS